MLMIYTIVTGLLSKVVKYKKVGDCITELVDEGLRLAGITFERWLKLDC